MAVVEERKVIDEPELDAQGTVMQALIMDPEHEYILFNLKEWEEGSHGQQ